MNMQTPMRASTALITELKAGHEFPGANINSRVANRKADVEQLAASILAEGLLLPLIVVPDPKAADSFYVVDGNRRRDAIELLVKSKRVPKDAEWDIRVETSIDAATALRKSLAANMHVPLHPVDQYEAFAACLDKGDTPAAIAEKYALTEKVVKQRLALANLSPVIREAWRHGKIDRDVAQAYAATSDHQRQEKLWKHGGWEAKQEHSIRSALIGQQSRVEGLLKFVGEDAYKAAGGKLNEDLFGPKEGAKIADFGILQRLVQTKLKAEAAKFLEKGWGWAAPLSDLPREADYAWPTKGNATNEEKKKLGVIVDVDYHGKLETKTGVIKPGTKGVKPSHGLSVPKPPKKKPSGLISNSLAQRLSEQLTYAIGNTVAQMPDVALTLALAALASDGGPIRLEEKGLATIRSENGVNADKDKPDFVPTLPGFLKLSTKDKLAALARIVGRSVDFQTQSAEHLPLSEDDCPVVVKLLDGKTLAAELRKQFVAEDYFSSISTEQRVKAIREMDAAQADPAAKAKKSAQVTIAVQCFGKSKDWLPPELRTSHYSGPGEKAKAAKKPGKRKAR